MKWFRGIPDKHGWYFYAASPENWDLATPVPVTKIEDSHGVRFEVGESVIQKDDPGIWYGPVNPPIQTPPPEVMDALECRDCGTFVDVGVVGGVDICECCYHTRNQDAEDLLRLKKYDV